MLLSARVYPPPRKCLVPFIAEEKASVFCVFHQMTQGETLSLCLCLFLCKDPPEAKRAAKD